jgi:hypothetical protein
MDPTGLAFGTLGFGFQFFHVARKACQAIGTARCLSKDATSLHTLFHIEQIKYKARKKE